MAQQTHSTPDTSHLFLVKTADFTVTGDGRAAAWNATSWVTLPVREAPGKPLATRMKALYSDKGLYFLFDCADRKLSVTYDKDYEPLFREDVLEVFLWPDTTQTVYFEYEISPLNYQWPVKVSHSTGRYQGMPVRYEDKKLIQHATHVEGGEKKSMATVTRWRAEFFISYKVMGSLIRKIPQPGTRWRGNFYRVDHDEGYTTWTWKNTGLNFHNYYKFGTLVFR